MKLRLLLHFGLLALGLATVSFAQSTIPASPLNFQNSSGQPAHIFPSVPHAKELGMFNTPSGLDTGPLLYHSGGTIMQTGNIYAIYWAPAKLQNGSPAGMTSHYRTVNSNMLNQYMGHGIGSNNTQYYQISSTGTKSYIWNKGMLVTSFVDTNPYPASGCTDGVTGTNCITDAQLVAEIQRVMSLKSWHASSTNIFMVFTSQGEGSCFDSSSSACAYTYYCAYHSTTSSASTGIIYSNEPWGDPNYCNTNPPSPNNDLAADTAATASSHELTEATTDPKLNAWFTANGSEIGDLCAYQYGTNTWDSGKANQSWGPVFLEIQTEWDNHTGSCVQVGP
jgi:hypothetical protein